MAGAPDIIVIGGGVIGCAVAYELAKRKARVLVLERDEIGAGATQAAAGMIAPLSDTVEEGPMLDLGVRSFHMYRDFLAEVEEAAGMSAECLEIGIIRTAMREEETPALRGALEVAACLGLELHWLDGDEARKLEPRLGPSVIAATHSPNEPNLNPMRLVEALRRAAVAHGAEFREHAPVSGLARSGDRVVGARIGGETVAAERLVLATGAWACQAGDWLGLELPIHPVRGQVAYVDKLPVSLRHTVMHGLRYAVPKGDGATLVGSTLEKAGFDQRVTAGGLATILSDIQALVPSVGETTVNHTRAGLRPWCRDSLPVMGPAPGAQNVIIAGGHYRSGILLSAITSRMIGDLMIDGPGAVELGPLDAARLESRES